MAKLEAIDSTHSLFDVLNMERISIWQIFFYLHNERLHPGGQGLPSMLLKCQNEECQFHSLDSPL